MAVRKYASRSQKTTLASAITTSSASITVVSAASLMGGKTLTANERYTVVIDPDTALEEIVQVFSSTTNPVSGNTLAIARGIDGSIPQNHSAGAEVRHMAIGQDYQEANDHINETTNAHGLVIANVVETTDTGTVSTTMLADSAVTSAKIADGTIVNADINASAAIAYSKLALTGSITSSDITDGTIVNADINAAAAIAPTKISGTAVTQADTGTVTSAMIANNTIVDADISTGAAIAKTKISGTAVTLSDIGTVTSTMIADGSIVNADIHTAAAIAATKIAGTAVTQADTGTVTSTMIANGTIVDADVSATAAIAKTKLNLGGTITSADLVDGTIVATDIADGTITAAKMVSDPYARANHTGTQTASTISDLATVVKAYRVDEFAVPENNVNWNGYKITNLADPASAQDASTKAYVDTKINDLVNGAPTTLDTLKEIADAISAGGSFESTVVLKSGSTMTGALVLNADPSVNLGAATKQYVDAVAGSATAAAASAAAAAATYDNFDDRYLGAKSSAPTVDNDGNALIEGALYWNSVDNAMYAWTGTEWGSISSTAEIYRFRFTASGGETSVSGTDDNGLTLSYLPGKEQVYLNGVLLARTSDYTASTGTSITSLAALAASDIVEIITFTSFEVADAIARTVFDAKGDLLVGTAADTVGKLSLGSNGMVLVADSSTSTGLKWSTYDPLPSQSGNTGKYLQTDGSTTSWAAVDALPSQSGNTGKYLTTDGSTASWASVTTDPTADIFMLMGA